MNKIVLEHYPVSRLPDDLREAVGDAKEVTLTIEAEDGVPDNAASPASSDDWFSKHKHIRRENFKTVDEVNDYVRSLRDEWSHRER
ncbi:MAG: hypothetical protein WBQ53_01250 [Methylocystis sp.]